MTHEGLGGQSALLDSRWSRLVEPRGPSLLVALLVVANFVYRWVIAQPGYFWQDDYYIAAWAKFNPLSLSYVLLPFSDHFQPLGLTLAWVCQRLFPGSYAAAMCWTAMLYAISIWVFYRLLIQLFGWRNQLFLVLLLWGFSVFTLQSYLWYAASLYLAPFLVFVPLSLLAAIHYLRSPSALRLLWAFLSALLAVLSHTFAITVPLLTLLLVFVVGVPFSSRQPGASRARRIWPVLVAQCLPALLVALYYLDHKAGARDLTLAPWDGVLFALRELVWVTVPALVGGPWRYNGYLSPEFPIFTPLGGFLVMEFVLMLVVLARVKPKALILWICATLLVLLQVFVVTLGRGGGETELVVRYTAPGLVALSLAVAFTIASPTHQLAVWRRGGADASQLWRKWGSVPQVLVVALLAQAYIISFSFSVSVPAFETPFAFNRAYMEQLTVSASEVPSGVRLIPQFVPRQVVGVNAPGPTSTQLVLASQARTPAFADQVSGQLWGFTPEGKLAEQRVWGVSATAKESNGCVARLAGTPLTLPLDNEAQYWFATVSVGTLAQEKSGLRVELVKEGVTTGQASLMIPSGLQRTYAPLPGEGSSVRLVPQSAAPICVTDLTVGERFHQEGSSWVQDGSSLATQSFELGGS